MSALPSDINGWPKLVIKYPTEPDAIQRLLPPGFVPAGDPVVSLSVYCVPVHDEPELGISTKVGARFGDLDGWYTLGIGIDQESAIFISRETNGQPKFPCDVTYYSNGTAVVARAFHQGVTFMSYRGEIGGDLPVSGQEFDENEWWIKVSRAVGGASNAYDFPPHVVRVHTKGTITRRVDLTGRLELTPSQWDPYTTLLPMNGPATAELVSTRFSARDISLHAPLDAEEFWPHADTIGGSRWPGFRGGPRPEREIQ